MLHPSTTRCLPARYRDRILTVSAYTGFIAVGIFTLTQYQPRLAIADDLRFQLVLWLVMIGGTAGICRRMQPTEAGLVEAMRRGRTAAKRGACPPAAERGPRYRHYGRAGAALYAAVAAIEAGADTGILDLHGVQQYMVVVTLSILGAVGVIVRISVPFIEKTTSVFMAAYQHPGIPEDTGPIPRVAHEART